MNKFIKYGLILAGVILLIVSVGVGLAFISMQPDKSSTDSVGASTTKGSTKSNVITPDLLAQKNGLNGNDCYVAINGTVYLIKGVAQWAMGVHTTANDPSVACGRDLTQKLKESPHGSRVLQKLPVVGTLQN